MRDPEHRNTIAALIFAAILAVSTVALTAALTLPGRAQRAGWGDGSR